MNNEDLLELVDKIVVNLKIECKPDFYSFEKEDEECEFSPYLLKIVYKEYTYPMNFCVDYRDSVNLYELPILNFIQKSYLDYKNTIENRTKELNLIKCKMYKKQNKFKSILNKLLGVFCEE